MRYIAQLAKYGRFTCAPADIHGSVDIGMLFVTARATPKLVLALAVLFGAPLNRRTRFLCQLKQAKSMSLDNPDFFYRQIVRLERCEDNGIVTFEISLDCGHEQSWMSWPMG